MLSALSIAASGDQAELTCTDKGTGSIEAEHPTCTRLAGGLSDGIQLFPQRILDAQPPALLLRSGGQHQSGNQIRGCEVGVPKQPRHPLRHAGQRRTPAPTAIIIRLGK